MGWSAPAYYYPPPPLTPNTPLLCPLYPPPSHMIPYPTPPPESGDHKENSTTSPTSFYCMMYPPNAMSIPPPGSLMYSPASPNSIQQCVTKGEVSNTMTTTSEVSAPISYGNSSYVAAIAYNSYASPQLCANGYPGENMVAKHYGDAMVDTSARVLAEDSANPVPLIEKFLRDSVNNSPKLIDNAESYD